MTISFLPCLASNVKYLLSAFRLILTNWSQIHCLIDYFIPLVGNVDSRDCFFRNSKHPTTFIQRVFKIMFAMSEDKLFLLSSHRTRNSKKIVIGKSLIAVALSENASIVHSFIHKEQNKLLFCQLIFRILELKMKKNLFAR